MLEHRFSSQASRSLSGPSSSTNVIASISTTVSPYSGPSIRASNSTGVNRGAFTPQFSEHDWDGVLSSTIAPAQPRFGPIPRSQAPSGSSNLFVKKELPTPKPKNRAIPTTGDEVKDLTSDNEQDMNGGSERMELERQNLLSSFAVHTERAK